MEMPKEPRESHNSNIPGAEHAGIELTEQAVIGSTEQSYTEQAGKESTKQAGIGSAEQADIWSTEQAEIGSTEHAGIGSTEQAGIELTEQDGIGIEDWPYNLDEDLDNDPFFTGHDDEAMFESENTSIRTSHQLIQDSPPDNTIFLPIIEDNGRTNVDDSGTSTQSIRKRKETSSSDTVDAGSSVVGNDLYLNQVFTSRAELVLQLKKISILINREFKTKWCDKRRFLAVCRDEKCPWRLRASPNGVLWVVTRYHKIHTCSVDLVKHSHRNASDQFVAEIIKDHFSNPTHAFPPAAVISEVKKSLFIDLNYHTAWRAREKAIGLVMGTPVESFAKLPAYFHRLKEVNPGTITHIERHEDGHFKYCFMSLGASQRGFLANIRPVIAIDGTFLRGKYGGTLLLATAMDGNKQLYPIAFGIVDSENNESWNWFLSKLHEIIGHVLDLVIISDRHKSIMKGVADVFPDAVHGICIFHLKMNVAAKFKKVDVAALLYKAGKTYDEAEHKSCMNAILQRDPRVYNYLTGDAKVEQWARVYFPGNRYSIMTTNIAESMNAVLKDVRTYPPVSLMDTIVTKLSLWYARRREIAMKMNGPLTTWAEKRIIKRDELSRSYSTRQVNNVTYYVGDGKKNTVVDLHGRTCTCRRFQLDKLPCSHALAAAAVKEVSKFDLSSPYYSSEYLLLAYSESIMPVGHEDEWNTPFEVSNPTLLFPKNVRGIGRPDNTSRILSQGEEPPLVKTCGKCKKKGHNRRTCKDPVG
ncbi:hypothetical protein CASFOL_012974 [Castilleja foliolosa]|uniref:SWIM-type domain-containing protein n=2 Tax=Castilleja foliolosa TaxID=1961234 RepID=A0ABD3DMF7_9LAMI